MKVLLIDNGSSLLRKLQQLIPGAEITKKWRDVSETDNSAFDLVVLSGSSVASVTLNKEDFKNEISLIQETRKPVIGICFGCELITVAFGGTLKEMNHKHKGLREIEILDPSISEKKFIYIYECHRWMIDHIPDQFSVLAKAKDEPEIIKHLNLPIFGLQFHPENFVEETDGDEIFLRIFGELTKSEISLSN